MENKNLPACCQPKDKSLRNGILFGLLPHAGCIAFVAFSLLGLTVAASVFKPLLAKSYLFYIMIALSFVFATLSAGLYLRKQGGLKTAKHHKKYLSILYGTTIAVSLLLYFVIFPLVAGSAASTGNAIGPETMTIQVQIPCSGHAPLITSELKNAGVNSVQYIPSNKFKLTYDSTKITKEQILDLAIFKEYPAKIV